MTTYLAVKPVTTTRAWWCGDDEKFLTVCGETCENTNTYYAYSMSVDSGKLYR